MLPLDHYRKMEADHRRASAWSTSSDLPHPDHAYKMILKDVAWAVPSCGIRVSPAFTDDGVSAQVEGADKWPTAAEIVRDMPVQDDVLCETCGQPTKSFLEVVADNAKQMEWLGKAMALMCDLLDVYYDLSDEQKAALLSFPIGQTPEWPARLLEWCRGEGGGE